MSNHNVGRQIRILAIIFALIIFLVGVYLSYDYARDDWYGFHYIDFIIGLVIFAVSAYISTIFIYGFGELVENSAKIAENTSKLLAEQKKNESDTTKDSINMN